MSIKTLIVDDSAMIRKVISDILSSDSDIEVLGTASSGEMALEKLKRNKPDVITLDVEMPGIDGLETLKRIKQEYPEIRVMMVSSHTEVGTAVTVDALTQGAFDYITKPSSKEGGLSKDDFATLLVRKLKNIDSSKRTRTQTKILIELNKNKEKEYKKPTLTSVDLMLIGVSTGGPKALANFLPKIPKNFPAPILIVQHMPATFTKPLADRLNEQSDIIVVEAEEDMHAKAGCAYIAPGDFHMEVFKEDSEWVLRMNQNEPENSCRPAVDVLFRSAVNCAKNNILGIMLTGMGQDGLIGCEAIKNSGGMVLCQDEESSVVWGMPGYVVQNNLADGVYPLDNLPAAIKKICNKTGQFTC